MRRAISQLVFWLTMLALPLQGWAAASMLYCATLPAAVVQPQQPTAHHADAQHGNALQQHGHDAHASMSGSSSPFVAAQNHTADQSASSASSAHDLNKCSTLCAACLNLAATLPTMPLMGTQAVPQQHHLEPLHPAYSAPARLPEKPPRA